MVSAPQPLPKRPQAPATTRWPERDDPRDNVLVVTRGHPFVRDPFFEIFESNPNIQWSSVEHPAAQLMFTPKVAQAFDCLVLYDMPGIVFNRGSAPTFFDPPESFKSGLLGMLDAGVPLVVMHHACAAWPNWTLWAEIVGGHFLYQPGTSRGVSVPDSGYVIDVEHTVSPVGAHPISEGIEPFVLTDELYLAHVFEDSVTPLFRSDFDFVDTNFYSAAAALEGKLNHREGWQHPPGSNIVGWVKSYLNSPIVYLQFGDGPATYRNQTFRQILANAISWAASEEAASWARDQQ